MCKYFPEITSSWNSVFSYKDYSEFVTFIPMQIILNGLSKEESETTEQLSTILFIVEGKCLGGAREDFRGATTGYGWGIPVLQFVNFIMLYTLDLRSLVYAYYANPQRKICCFF